jgi:two-component system cell cycle sensor histidine kinase/response regulator CckA
MPRPRIPETFSVSRLAHSLLSNTSDALIGLDSARKIQSWNPAAETIYGYTPSEIVGKDFSILFASDNEGDERIIAEEKLATGEPVKGWEVRQLHKSGSIVHTSVDMWTLSAPDGAPEGTCVSVKAIAKYRMLQSQLRQTGKLETVGRLAGGIAHDFNNLLTVISGYNEMIMRKSSAESNMREWSIEVDKAAERAILLTNQLLAFSRREVTQPRVLNLNDSVQDLDKMLRRIIGVDVEIVLLLEPGIDNIRADAGQISQVLTNLVANARDAMPRGGTLTIATRSAHFDTSVAHHDFELPPGPYVQLTVTDTGGGMDQETREHLFEPFFTTKSKGRGTGLGLSIVFGIVSQLRGEISVSSQLGSGSTFTIYLPATAEPLEKRVSAPPLPVSPDVTILVVECDGDLRHLIRHMLLARGYTVYETADSREAIRICETVHIDVLLTDIVMPGMTGVELAARLLHSSTSLKILYMSGYVSDSIVPPEGLEPGHNFLQKPFTAARLNEQIINVLRTDGRANTATAP